MDSSAATEQIHRLAPAGSGPCAKQTVTATLICTNGQRYVATNHCLCPQQTCPRGGLPTGAGYELCKSVCQQSGHAELNAIRVAGENAQGGTLYLEGHTYACESCQGHAARAGIARILIEAPPLLS